MTDELEQPQEPTEERHNPELERMREETARLNQQLQEQRQMLLSMQPRPQAGQRDNYSQKRLEESGITDVDALRQLVREEAGQISSEAMNQLYQVMQKMANSELQVPEYGKAKYDIQSWMARHPEVRDEWASMYQYNPTAAARYAAAMFEKDQLTRRGETKKAESQEVKAKQAQARADADIVSGGPTVPEGQTEKDVKAYNDQLAQAYEHAQVTGDARPYWTKALKDWVKTIDWGHEI